MRRGFSNAAPQWRAFVDGGASSLAISAETEDAGALIARAAARLRNGERGGIAVLEGDEMNSFLAGSRKHSVHAIGLVDLASSAPFSGNLPQRRARIGIEPQFIVRGEPLTKAGLSPAVELQ